MSELMSRKENLNEGKGRKKMIIVGDGKGIGKIEGIVREKRKNRNVKMFLGMRNKERDLLYNEDLKEWKGEGSIKKIKNECQSVKNKRYVKEELRKDEEEIERIVKKGERVMVCGGREMEEGV